MSIELQQGDVVAGRYAVERKLGSGGVGTVYLVLDQDLGNRPVALKVLSAAFVDDPVMYRRFQDEVSLTRELSHPNIIRVFDIGKGRSGVVFLTMEYINGQSLSDLMEDWHTDALPFQDVVWILQEICQGLEYAHSKGVIHRDLKPENVLVTTQGELRLVDFGLARWRSSKRRTAVGETVGTPLYMSPEQFRGKDVDARCDVYSLGLLAYELVSGKPPFESSSVGKLAQMHAGSEIPDLQEIRSDLPKWYRLFIRKCSAKHPTNRFQDCSEALQYLQQNFQLSDSDSRTNLELSERVSTIKKSLQQIQSKQTRPDGTKVKITPQPIPTKFHRRHLRMSKRPQSSLFARAMAVVFIIAMMLIIFVGSKY